jgi:hypothetical protein
LTGLHFVRKAPAGSGLQDTSSRLGELPAVLVSEAYNDLRLMAGDGTGFDPDWKKKSEY